MESTRGYTIDVWASPDDIEFLTTVARLRNKAGVLNEKGRPAHIGTVMREILIAHIDEAECYKPWETKPSPVQQKAFPVVVPFALMERLKTVYRVHELPGHGNDYGVIIGRMIAAAKPALLAEVSALGGETATGG